MSSSLQIRRTHEELSETSSTQDEARRRIEVEPVDAFGELKTVWVSARAQSAGRGRQGRGWIALPGDLTVSCAFRFPKRVELKRPLLTLIAGQSLYESVRGREALPCFVKWPNDLFTERGGWGKLAGILAEGFGQTAVVGWGVNLVAGQRIIPPGAYRAVSCADLATEPFSAAFLLPRLLDAFEAALGNWIGDSQVFEAELIRKLRAETMVPFFGTEGILKASGERVFARDIDADGALLVSSSLADPRPSWRRVLSGEFEMASAKR